MSTKQENYMQKRWMRQYDYYSRMAVRNKKIYRRIQISVGVAGVMIPVLINLSVPNIFVDPVESVPMPTIIPTLLGLFIAVATVFENVNRYGDNWRNYRQAVEAMKRELAMYDTLTGEYSRVEDPFSLFVERSEAIMGEETSRFVQMAQQQPEIVQQHMNQQKESAETQ